MLNEKIRLNQSAKYILGTELMVLANNRKGNKTEKTGCSLKHHSYFRQCMKPNFYFKSSEDPLLLQ